MSIKTKTTALVLLASLLASTSSFAQSSLTGVQISKDSNGRTVNTGKDAYGNSIVRTFHPLKYNYAFEIDCYDRSVSNAGTNDAISVVLSTQKGAMNGSQTSVFQREKTAPNCTALSDARYSVTGQTSPLSISQVTVATSGSDALWIDEAYLKQKTIKSWTDKITSSNGMVNMKDNESRSSFKTIKQWGNDGGKGYCISTNPASANAFGNHVDHCAPKATFNVASGTVSMPRAQQALKAYRVEIKTSDIRRAGTDANIYLTLRGSKGTVGGSTGVLLNPKISGNAFERGDLDTVNLANQSDIGRISSIILRSDGNHPGADWNVKYVRVNGVTFNCGDREIEGAGSMTCSR